MDVVRSPAPPSLGAPPVPKLSDFQKLVDLVGVCLKRHVLSLCKRSKNRKQVKNTLEYYIQYLC